MTSLHEFQPGTMDTQAMHVLTKMAAEDDGIHMAMRDAGVEHHPLSASDDQKRKDQYMLFSSLF